MSFLRTIRNIRILPTARAIKRLENAGIVLLSNNLRLQARGRIGAGRKNSKKIRLLAKPEIIRDFELRNFAVDLDIIEIESIQEGLEKNVILSRTRWLIEKVKSAGSSRRLNRILKKAGISRDEIEADIAEEFRISLDGLAKKTVKLNRKKSREVVGLAARDFIELANLSNRGDEEFVGFIINILIKASSKHDASLPVHYGAVVFYSAAIAVELGMPADVDIFQWLKTAALHHDIGKIAIPQEYHEKRILSDYDLLIVREHLPITVHLFEQIRWLKNVIPIIQHHHDNVKGYRSWVYQGMEKLAPAMVMCVEILKAADAFDGMTSKRPYKDEGEEYEQIRNGKVYKQKVYRQGEALTLLEKWGWDVGVLQGLKRVLQNGKKYIYDLKKYFKRNELKLGWFGIEHLVKKTVLPFEGKSLDLKKDELILMDHRAMLWLMSGRVLKHEDANEFIRIVMREIRAGVERSGLHKPFGRVFALELNLRWRGLLYILLYRALKVDVKENSNTFSKLVQLAIHLLGDPSALKGMINSFKLDNENYPDEKFEWISLKLYGNDASHVPLMGSKAFVQKVSELFSAEGLG
jgi:HD-GYP domain-containing protein (c-di-GMP phosphodiesterase class II)